MGKKYLSTDATVPTQAEQRNNYFVVLYFVGSTDFSGVRTGELTNANVLTVRSACAVFVINYELSLQIIITHELFVEGIKY